MLGARLHDVRGVDRGRAAPYAVTLPLLRPLPLLRQAIEGGTIPLSQQVRVPMHPTV